MKKYIKPENIENHYTKEEMAKDLISILPLRDGNSVLDAGSGNNKVWFNNTPEFCIKEECELEDGNDFYDVENVYDWIIGNPPFSHSWAFTEKAFDLN